jgi:hypothetical protein
MGNLRTATATTRMVFMTDEDNHVDGLPGLTLAIAASKDGGAFAAITPTVTDRGDGWYALALTAAHTDTPGELALHITATGADPTDKLYEVGPAPAHVVDFDDALGLDAGEIPTASETADAVEVRLNALNVAGTVTSATTPTTTTLSATVDVTPTDVDQWQGRILIFGRATATAGLRLQATDVLTSTAPGGGAVVLTFTALTTAPAADDTFVLV